MFQKNKIPGSIIIPLLIHIKSHYYSLLISKFHFIAKNEQNNVSEISGKFLFLPHKPQIKGI